MTTPAGLADPAGPTRGEFVSYGVRPGPVDITEHKRDPSGQAVRIDHDTRLRDLTLLVDERNEVTSDYFVA